MAFAKQMMAAKGYGVGRSQGDEDKHWSALGVLDEILLWEENRVDLAREKDRLGLPAAKVTFDFHKKR